MDAAGKRRALEELRFRQRRLGTCCERPDDHERVCELAHLLNNRATVEMLLSATRAIEGCSSPAPG
jgi:hypothetical protein